jgi:hypothetical protein
MHELVHPKINRSLIELIIARTRTRRTYVRTAIPDRNWTDTFVPYHMSHEQFTEHACAIDLRSSTCTDFSPIKFKLGHPAFVS